jgi:hypothetical protein
MSFTFNEGRVTSPPYMPRHFLPLWLHHSIFIGLYVVVVVVSSVSHSQGASAGSRRHVHLHNVVGHESDGGEVFDVPQFRTSFAAEVELDILAHHLHLKFLAQTVLHDVLGRSEAKTVAESPLDVSLGRVLEVVDGDGRDLSARLVAGLAESEHILAVTREKSIARLQLKHVCQCLECPLWFPPSIRLTVRPYLIQSRQRHAFVVRRVERCLRTGPDPVQSRLRKTNVVQIVIPKEVFASKTYKPLRLDWRTRLAVTSREAMQGKCLDMLIVGYCEK